MQETAHAGFKLTHENTKLTAWGPDIESAFEAALTGLLNVAGAPEGIQPGGKSITIQGTGKDPAALLDDLVMALDNERKIGQPLDGSISMGGLVRSDTGWNGWASAGIDPDQKAPLGPFELVMPPLVERKPGRVTVKAQLMVWDDKMLEAMEKLKKIVGFHPGGVFGPDPYAIEEP